jgi:hypothetical protein
MTFKWTPGNGINLDAVHRLEAFFPRPKETMGEAWFLGDKRRMFHELNTEPSTLSTDVLEDAFGEIIGGIRSF